MRGRRSRARILDAARSLFQERGFDATTLRAIAERAGMGASSIYRHIRSKEELLVEELGELQEQAWAYFRKQADREEPARDRLRRFLDLEHALLVQDPDFTIIALRATTHPDAPVAKRVFAMRDRTVGLIAEILMMARAKGELAHDIDVMAAATTIAHGIDGARIAWANGLLSADACREAIDAAVALLFRGIQAQA